MPRLRVEIPDSYFFQTELSVRITDINYGNHVGNDAFVGLIHEARMQWLHQRGWSELDIEGHALIMVDLAIQFKHQVRFGERLKVDLGVVEWLDSGFILGYRLSQSSTGRLVSQCTTSMVFFDYSAQRVAIRPSWFQSRILSESE
jgi:acyl-CoA thioesterase FadM